MRWSGATGAIARGKRVSTGCGRKRRSVPAWPWICGVKPKPKAVNKPSPHSIVHGLDKPGAFTTVSHSTALRGRAWRRSSKASGGEDLQVEHPVCGGYAPSFHFHTTLTSMLGPTLIRYEVV